MNAQHLAWSLSAGLLIALVACGGGGGSAPMAGGATVQAAPSGAMAGALSSGTITAFGSVFVNGHEFDIRQASVVDDDSGTSSAASGAALEVGMVLDVKPASVSSNGNPVASELHLHPLARGYVDASNPVGQTLTVMGQTVQLSSSTLYSDHRACVSASSSPCTAVSAQNGLSATTGSGASAVAGSYVTVHGYLLNAGASGPNIVASLISVSDAPTVAVPVAYKVEGTIASVSGSQLTIGALSIDLGQAGCYLKGSMQACAGAFNSGQVVSVFSASPPSLPAASFSPGIAILRDRLGAQTVGATVEFEGAVAQVSSSPASFVLRGLTVDASALPMGTSLPVVGDIVRVTGTVNAGGGIAANQLQILRAARSASYNFEGDLGSVNAGSQANTFVVTLLGQSITVSATTRLADVSSLNWAQTAAASKLFNINTFQAYLAMSSSKHLVVYTAADASGHLSALNLLIVPASSTSGVDGLVDSSPAPVTSSVTGTPSLLSVHGLAISADPNATRYASSTKTIAAGDRVIGFGAYAGGALSIGPAIGSTNVLLDYGPPRQPGWMGP